MLLIQIGLNETQRARVQLKSDYTELCLQTVEYQLTLHYIKAELSSICELLHVFGINYSTSENC